MKKQIQIRTNEIEAVIKKYLPKEEGLASSVIAAMNYSVNAGGKRLRPMLMLETYKMFGGEGAVIEPFLAAIEMIHTYSLVHDDLPAMDNDEYRRGKKTTWVEYGEAKAILAGDALLNYAFETALKAFLCDAADNVRVAKALSILAAKAGIEGMIGGQVADIEAEGMGDKVTLAHLLYIHEHKTAALIQASMMIGAVLAGADEIAVAQVERCAGNIGVAFQIQDDILDVTSSLEVLGKPIGSDAKNHKLTYVTMHGPDESKRQVKALSEEAVAILQSFEKRNPFLENLVEWLIYREK